MTRPATRTASATAGRITATTLPPVICNPLPLPLPPVPALPPAPDQNEKRTASSACRMLAAEVMLPNALERALVCPNPVQLESRDRAARHRRARREHGAKPHVIRQPERAAGHERVTAIAVVRTVVVVDVRRVGDRRAETGAAHVAVSARQRVRHHIHVV